MFFIWCFSIVESSWFCWLFELNVVFKNIVYLFFLSFLCILINNFVKNVLDIFVIIILIVDEVWDFKFVVIWLYIYFNFFIEVRIFFFVFLEIFGLFCIISEVVVWDIFVCFVICCKVICLCLFCFNLFY